MTNRQYIDDMDNAAAPIQTIEAVIDAIAKPQREAARRIGSSDSRLSKWKRRGIPRSAWPDIVRVSSGRVTYADLERVEAAQREAA